MNLVNCPKWLCKKDKSQIIAFSLEYKTLLKVAYRFLGAKAPLEIAQEPRAAPPVSLQKVSNLQWQSTKVINSVKSVSEPQSPHHQKNVGALCTYSL